MGPRKNGLNVTRISISPLKEITGWNRVVSTELIEHDANRCFGFNLSLLFTAGEVVYELTIEMVEHNMS